MTRPVFPFAYSQLSKFNCDHLTQNLWWKINLEVAYTSILEATPILGNRWLVIWCRSRTALFYASRHGNVAWRSAQVKQNMWLRVKPVYSSATSCVCACSADRSRSAVHIMCLMLSPQVCLDRLWDACSEAIYDWHCVILGFPCWYGSLNMSIIEHIIKLTTPFYSIVDNLTTHTWGEWNSA
jgi:hypothetical protein